jgi:hypothetical protein
LGSSGSFPQNFNQGYPNPNFNQNFPGNFHPNYQGNNFPMRERAVRRMALTIEALTVTMICKWCVLMSGGRTRSGITLLQDTDRLTNLPQIVAISSDTTMAADLTTVHSAAIVVSLLIATIWGRLVRRSVSCRRVILRKLIVDTTMAADLTTVHGTAVAATTVEADSETLLVLPPDIKDSPG